MHELSLKVGKSLQRRSCHLPSFPDLQTGMSKSALLLSSSSALRKHSIRWGVALSGLMSRGSVCLRFGDYTLPGVRKIRRAGGMILHFLVF